MNPASKQPADNGMAAVRRLCTLSSAAVAAQGMIRPTLSDEQGYSTTSSDCFTGKHCLHSGQKVVAPTSSSDGAKGSQRAHQIPLFAVLVALA